MQNPWNQILGIDFHCWADVLRSLYFLKCSWVTVWGLKDVGKLFCERKLCRFCERELLPHCFLMRSKEIFFPWWEAREREGGEEREREEREKKSFLFNQWIILREKNVWSCYNNCYSALLFERAIVAALKKNLEFREAIGGSFLCVCSPKLAAYWRCSYITEQSFFFQAFWYSA